MFNLKLNETYRSMESWQEYFRLSPRVFCTFLNSEITFASCSMPKRLDGRNLSSDTTQQLARNLVLWSSSEVETTTSSKAEKTKTSFERMPEQSPQIQKSFLSQLQRQFQNQTNWMMPVVLRQLTQLVWGPQKSYKELLPHKRHDLWI